MGGVIHYGGILAVGAGAVATGQLWTMMLAGGVIGGLFAHSIKKNRQILEEGLVEHPHVHKYSPNLQEIVKRLFKRSGLDEHETVVYDFQVKPNAKHKYGVLGKVIGEMLGKIAMTPNAAAFNMGKPVIMISDPLLELLHDDEEEAVLAHEFAHAVAMHQHVALPHRILSQIAKTSNSLALFSEFISSGAMAVGISFYASWWLNNMVKALHPDGHLLEKKNESTEESELPPYLRRDPEEPNMRELYKIKRLKGFTKTASSLVTAGICQCFNPLYLPVYGAAKGLNLAAEFLDKSFSRNKEYQADRGAVVLGASPLALITALRKMTIVQKRSIEKAWLPDEMPEPGMLARFWKNSFSTHPAVERRINRLVSIAKQSGFSEAAIERAVHGPLLVPDTVEIPVEHIMGMAKAFVGDDSFMGIRDFNAVMGMQGQQGKLAAVPA